MDQTKKFLLQLRQKMEQHFDLDELRVLCFDLGIEWEELVGNNKPTVVVSLIKYVFRHNRFADLLTQLREKRSSVEWPNIDPVKVELIRLSQKNTSTQSRNSITAKNGGTIIIGGDVIQESNDNSLDADSEGVVKAKRVVQRDKKK